MNGRKDSDGHPATFKAKDKSFSKAGSDVLVSDKSITGTVCYHRQQTWNKSGTEVSLRPETMQYINAESSEGAKKNTLLTRLNHTGLCRGERKISWGTNYMLRYRDVVGKACTGLPGPMKHQDTLKQVSSPQVEQRKLEWGGGECNRARGDREKGRRRVGRRQLGRIRRASSCCILSPSRGPDIKLLGLLPAILLPWAWVAPLQLLGLCLLQGKEMNVPLSQENFQPLSLPWI